VFATHYGPADYTCSVIIHVIRILWEVPLFLRSAGPYLVLSLDLIVPPDATPLVSTFRFSIIALVLLGVKEFRADLIGSNIRPFCLYLRLFGYSTRTIQQTAL